MDKIYSRPRIQLPKKKHAKKPSKIRVFLALIISSLLICVISFLAASYPILVASCKNAASSKAIQIVNKQVEKVMEGYSYNQLMEMEKDGNGNVIFMKSNTVLINQITSKIISNIQNEFDKMPTIMVFINYGSVSGIRVLRNVGPKFDIELEAAGGINTQLKSEFQSAGVNQTIHRIYLDISTSVSILTPVGCFGKDVESKVLLTEAVIVGNVPDTYYHLEGLNNSDVLEVME